MAKAKTFMVANVKYNSIRELADAYGLNYRTVANRMSRGGQSPEAAVELSLPNSKHKTSITLDGTTYPSIAAAARRYGVEPALVHGRLQRGESPEFAFQLGERLQKRGEGITVGSKTFPNLKTAAEYFKISYGVVRYRKKNKWTIRQVFELDPAPENKSAAAPQPITFRGAKYPSRKALAEAFGVDPNKFYKRLKNDWTVEQALDLADKKQQGKPKPIAIGGKSFKSRNEAARHFGIDTGTVATRINKQGWTIEQALGLDPPPPGTTTKFGFVYLIKNIRSGKSYVGITRKSYFKRLSEHLAAAGRGISLNPRGLHAALKELGEECFTIEVLAEAHTIGDLQRLEREYIKKLKTLAPDGYNLSTGGSMVDLPGRKIRIKSPDLKFSSIAEAARFFELEGGTVQHRLSKGYSVEQALGLEPLKWVSPEWHSVRVDGLDFTNLKEAAQHFGQSANRVRNRINKGWSVERSLKTQKVRQSKETVVSGKTYESIRAAARALGIHHETLRKRLNAGKDPLSGK